MLLCSVDEDYVFAVADGIRTERLLLRSEVEDAEWTVAEEGTAAELEAGLVADADEPLASGVVEVLNSFGAAWPICWEHRGVMGACDGWWYYNGEPVHDVAEVGRLEQRHVSPVA